MSSRPQLVLDTDALAELTGLVFACSHDLRCTLWNTSLREAMGYAPDLDEPVASFPFASPADYELDADFLKALEKL